MPTADPIETEEQFLSRRQRASPITLPEDPTDEELARNWLLSEADRKEVCKARGEVTLRRAALQLCVLRTLGRLLRQEEGAPVRILNHLNRQLGLETVVISDPPVRDKTEGEIVRRIRAYLAFRTFDALAQEEADAWIYAKAVEGLTPREIYPLLEADLQARKVVLPAPSTLERLIATVCTRAREEIYRRIGERLTDEMKGAMDDYLTVPEGQKYSPLYQLKQHPPEAQPATICKYVDRLCDLESMEVARLDLEDLGSEMVHHMAELARKYDAYDLKELPSAKRYALLACFFVDSRRTILDQLVQMHEQYLTGMVRRAENGLKARRVEYAGKRYRQYTRSMRQALGIFMDMSRAEATLRTEAFLEMEEGAIRHAMARYDDFEKLDDRGYADELISRYSHLRRYFPDFLRVPFQAEPGAERLLQAVELARGLPAGRRLPEGTYDGFVPAKLRAGLVDEDGRVDRRVWEIGLAFAVRDALRSGDFYLPDSRRHVSFSKMLYSDDRWEKERPRAYVDLELPTEAEKLEQRLRQEFEEAAAAVRSGLADNPFATVTENGLRLHRDDKFEAPASVVNLRRAIETHLDKVRIEQALMDVDLWCHFTRELRPVPGANPRVENLYVALLAAVVAHGTNLGVAAMGASTESVSVEILQNVTKWFIREDTVRAANASIVDYINTLPLSAVWGQGSFSSSDGQRFGLRASSLQGALHPRFFGYYQRAVTVYTHTADQFSVFSTQAISCSEREAHYVLEGLLENDTVLKHREHTTDTHGYTEQLFGLCFLLGFSFLPRIADLADQQLYKLDRHASYGPLDPLFRASVDLLLIKGQWDQLVRLASSLKNRTAKAHDVLKRLTNSPKEILAKALTALGQVVKTIYVLRYISDEPLRRRVQVQLNRGEKRHELARWLFFARQGEFRRGDLEEIMNKASCLSLLCNAVTAWNIVEMQTIVERLRKGGEEVSDEDLGHVWPLAHAHVIPNGTYHFRQGAEASNVAKFPAQH